MSMVMPRNAKSPGCLELGAIGWQVCCRYLLVSGVGLTSPPLFFMLLQVFHIGHREPARDRQRQHVNGACELAGDKVAIRFVVILE